MIRRVVVKAVGGLDQLEVEEGPPPPPPSKGQVTVLVKACGLNFYDIYVRHGLNPEVQPPCTLGLECAGVISAVAEDVQSVKVGDHVAVHCPQAGACAQQITVDEESVIVVAKDISFEVAASFTITYQTAYFSLFHLGGLRPGGAVFIHSAAGGVGWAATQLAKTIPDVTVFGTASAHKHDAIQENGVDYAIHHDQDYEKEVLNVRPQGVSIVLDNLAGADFTRSQNLLEPLGKVVLIGAKGMIKGEHRSLWCVLKTWWNTKNVSPQSLIMKNHAVAGFHLSELRKKDPKAFRKGWIEVRDMITNGVLSPRIDSVWKFEEILEASKQISEWKNIGKVIVKP
ncbi:synaptic vesicle membrane protein VAT-1 homolog isoform X2 [Penaeus chinensis]|uniref:synaptic vesicle membrane protein VAT-1 homolog isoform X2 n=1 Tax=Penaeus chinensis TaxID=139456 RepID=UPI001FB58084|nr:synaptic vesicle membrane protein VAT-1 homolog isoform X2 [Penaeus chinensis]